MRWLLCKAQKSLKVTFPAAIFSKRLANLHSSSTGTLTLKFATNPINKRTGIRYKVNKINFFINIKSGSIGIVKSSHIMSDPLTIISQSGRVFEMGDCWQVLLVRGVPTKIALARPDMISSAFRLTINSQQSTVNGQPSTVNCSLLNSLE